MHILNGDASSLEIPYLFKLGEYNKNLLGCEFSWHMLCRFEICANCSSVLSTSSLQTRMTNSVSYMYLMAVHVSNKC